MIIASAAPMPIGIPVTRLYEGPQTDGAQIEVRIMALRVATREEYLEYGRKTFGDKFEEDEDLNRGWKDYYLVSLD